jgi:predicted nucleotide-binding protein
VTDRFNVEKAYADEYSEKHFPERLEIQAIRVRSREYLLFELSFFFGRETRKSQFLYDQQQDSTEAQDDIVGVRSVKEILDYKQKCNERSG